ncbi:MAG: 4Fe-4S dicluster domain-containing protein [Bacteroidales bacterium]|jgi:ferredoxin|nr:4Fe-4S dicluster domain-containing protein [Bacteroidales bacterium]
MKTFYFSATGNSLYVAKSIGGELFPISIFINKELQIFKDEIIGFVFPCFSFEVPPFVKNFIENNSFSADYFFVIMTYGNTLGLGLHSFKKIAEQKNIKINYYNSVLMVDNFLPLFSIESQLKKEPKKKIGEKIGQIKSDIDQKKSNELKKQTFLQTVMNAFLRKININNKPKFDKYFKINSKCNKCGVCEKICFKNNIKIKEKPEYLHDCSLCFACIHSCPTNAIHVKFERSSTRFRNKNINLKELMNE